MGKCTGHVPIKVDGRIQRSEDGKPVTRPCRAPAIDGARVCKMHGGGAPQVKARAAVVAEVMRWGLGDTTIDPGEVLLRLVSQSAARAQRYADELQALVAEAEADGKNLRDALVREAYGEFGPTGEYVRGLVELENAERDRCAGFAAKAVAAGLAERQVRLAERQGELIAQVLTAVFDDLGLSEQQREAAPDVIRRHLRLIA